MKPKFKTISKDGAGRITSKLTKPKDWAHRTPGEGRPKLVHSGRAKQVPMADQIWPMGIVAQELLELKAGSKWCEWDISCMNPARKLTAQDVLDIIYYPNLPNCFVQVNKSKKILIFVYLYDVLSGGHSAGDKQDAKVGKRNKAQCFVCGHRYSHCTCDE